MKKIKKYVLLALLLLLVIVLVQNAGTDRVDFLFWNFSAPKFVIYICFFTAGFIAAELMKIWKKV